MTFDLFSLMVASALVVVLSGVLFILETLLRKDEGAGRVWSIAYLGAITSTLSYLVWAASPSAWWAVATGNAAFVVGTGFLWLGAVRFNNKSLRVPLIIVAAAGLLAFAAVLVEGPQGGDWAGAIVMFVALAAFAGAGAIESRRGEMGAQVNAIGLCIVLAVQSLFYIVRIVIFLTAGPDSSLFNDWVGTVTTSFLTIVLTTVAVVTTSVLRASRAGLRGETDMSMLVLGVDGVLTARSFRAVLKSSGQLAQANSERFGVLSLRIDDLPQISTAFGSAEASELTGTWRASVRQNAPTTAVVGEDGATRLLVRIMPTSVGDARRIASRIHRRLLDAFSERGTAVIPVVGVGVALSDVFGYDPETLIAAANEAATRSATNTEASVIIADSEEEPVT